jgi:hypothetical protein
LLDVLLFHRGSANVTITRAGPGQKVLYERVVDLHEPRTLDAVNRYVLHESVSSGFAWPTTVQR